MAFPSARRRASRWTPPPIASVTTSCCAARGAVLARRGLAGRGLRRGRGLHRGAPRHHRGAARSGAAADPSILEAYPRPDWYFLWYFAVLAMAPHHLETIIIVAGPLVFGALLLLVPIFNKGERSVRRRPMAALLVVFIWSMILVFWVAGERADWSPDFDAVPLPAHVVNSTDPAVVGGAKLFHDAGCEFCHAVAGYGGKRGPELTDVAARMSAEQITARITNGGPNMPAYVRVLTPAGDAERSWHSWVPSLESLVDGRFRRGPEPVHEQIGASRRTFRSRRQAATDLLQLRRGVQGARRWRPPPCAAGSAGASRADRLPPITQTFKPVVGHVSPSWTACRDFSGRASTSSERLRLRPGSDTSCGWPQPCTSSSSCQLRRHIFEVDLSSFLQPIGDRFVLVEYLPGVRGRAGLHPLADTGLAVGGSSPRAQPDDRSRSSTSVLTR